MFSPNAQNTHISFETDLLSGTLQPAGHHHGIRQLTHKPSGLPLVHPNFSLLNLYLLFTTGKCIASARTFQGNISAQKDHVHIYTDPTQNHPANLTLSYHLIPPNVIDLKITVHPQAPLRAYEALVAHYFDLAFKPQFCVSESNFRHTRTNMHWHTPIAQNQYTNNARIFPRDAHSAQMHRDGRWSNVKSIYQWKTQQYYALPIAIQVHAEHNIAIALMAHRETCPSFAWTIGMANIQQGSYGSDHLDDPYKARNPIYTSLFGQDLNPHHSHIAHMRLAVLPFDPHLSSVLTAYEDFLSA